MSDSDAAALLERLGDAHVAVLGDAMLDRYVDGAVERISPEAPIPVLSVRGERTAPGGAGNVTRNLTRLGARATLIAAIGADGDGAALEALLAREAGATLALERQADRPTAVKTRYMAGTQQLLRADREVPGPLDAQGEARLLGALSAALGAGARALVLSDYGKGLLSDRVIAAALAQAREAGAAVIVDPKGRDFARYGGADFITPNRQELALATGLPTEDDAEVEAAARAVARDAGIAAVLATRSERGMTLWDGRVARHLPARAREVFDVAGAGDTVVAALAAGLAGGAAALDAARLANVAAGVVVAKRGTAAVSPGEILAALHGEAVAAEDAKLATRAEAQARVAAWRARGLSVGFTNGCFDLLHPGHVSLLRQARAACDRLVVAINTDASVRRLKGPDRPIQGETSRAAVLAGLASVDLVTAFAEDTPLDLIRALKPDVLVKGADYRPDQVVGGPEVERWGGRVVLADLVDGHSTSAIARRIAAGE